MNVQAELRRLQRERAREEVRDGAGALVLSLVSAVWSMVVAGAALWLTGRGGLLVVLGASILAVQLGLSVGLILGWRKLFRDFFRVVAGRTPLVYTPERQRSLNADADGPMSVGFLAFVVLALATPVLVPLVAAGNQMENVLRMDEQLEQIRHEQLPRCADDDDDCDSPFSPPGLSVRPFLRHPGGLAVRAAL